MEDPCPGPECSNLWLAGSSAPAGSPAPRFARTLSNKVPSCHLPARGRLRRGSARGARREAPPPPYCTCPAEVRARNFAEPLRPVSARSVSCLLSQARGPAEAPLRVLDCGV